MLVSEPARSGGRSRARASIVACARWEASHIAEWLTFHRAIGFEHVFLYCNDDDPAELYACILPFGDFVTFHWYPMIGQQVFMYRHFLENHLRSTDWFQFLDIDEFVHLGPHANIGDYLDTIPEEWDSVYLNWVPFGPNAHETRPEGSVLLHYTRRAAYPDAHTKTITRSARVTSVDVGPHCRDIVFHHWGDPRFGVREKRNVLGDRMDPYWTDFPKAAYPYVQDPAHAQAILAGPCIFHYLLKSMADLKRRALRGIGGQFGDQDRWTQMHEDGTLAHILGQLDVVSDHRLRDAWLRLLAGWRDGAIPALSPWPNISAGKQADQSSVSPFSHGRTTVEDATGAITGGATGGYAFHTAEEIRPWWTLDLGEPHCVRMVRIYNRFENALMSERLQNFDVSASTDGQAWTTLAQHRGEVPPGGADGKPFSLTVADGVVCRYVRITLAGFGFLHLDHVEVFGLPL